ncbi:MAG TPA: ferrous iron transport protein B [Anaerolineaceae bacterium]|nr:ferrous iron transport protein B [Anaerolineaceae bacterium]
MRFALIGQPNCGKSTLFNQVAGYKAETGNFSGTSVTFTASKVRVMGQVVELVDLPGTYTLAGTNPAEREVFDYLASHSVDAIINVVDASHLAQGLELTLELLELERPTVVALNMIDEARRLGIVIDGAHLQERLDAPVLPMIASRGRGVKEVFTTTLRVAQQQKNARRIPFGTEVDETVVHLAGQLDGEADPLPATTAAIKLIEGDRKLEGQLKIIRPELTSQIEQARNFLRSRHGQDPVWVFGGERHARASEIAQAYILQGEHRLTWRDRLDDVLLHPVLGYVALISILFLFFQFVYRFGSLLEVPLINFFDHLNAQMQGQLANSAFLAYVLTGVIQGISGGVAIVLPYLTPFLLGLGLLEDIGYLPRVAFLMDALMHRLGLHGKAIVPFILGYGCNVPAIMSTRILEEKRDRYVAAALSTLVPCAARLAVVFGLVAFYLGPNMALLIYLLNLFVIALTARVLTRVLPEASPGLILEMPVYRMPTFRTLSSKTWFRIREFIVEAWPVLIAGSVVLALLNYFDISKYFNYLLTPLSWVLGLPNQVGVPLIFGILRKELSLIMLHQALGGVELKDVLTSTQMMTFSVFVVFYIPCLATLLVIRKELGNKAMAAIAGMTVVIATMAAFLARILGSIFFK